jgi:hypothetical protein
VNKIETFESILKIKLNKYNLVYQIRKVNMLIFLLLLLIGCEYHSSEETTEIILHGDQMFVLIFILGTPLLVIWALWEIYKDMKEVKDKLK